MIKNWRLNTRGNLVQPCLQSWAVERRIVRLGRVIGSAISEASLSICQAIPGCPSTPPCLDLPGLARSACRVNGGNACDRHRSERICPLPYLRKATHAEGPNLLCVDTVIAVRPSRHCDEGLRHQSLKRNATAPTACAGFNSLSRGGRGPGPSTLKHRQLGGDGHQNSSIQSWRRHDLAQETTRSNGTLTRFDGKRPSA